MTLAGDEWSIGDEDGGTLGLRKAVLASPSKFI
jgi:hypothetical protein